MSPRCLFMPRLRLLVLASFVAALAAGCGNGSQPTSPSALSTYQFPPGISYQVEGEPCIAAATGPGTCRFSVIPEAVRYNVYPNPYFQFNWRFTNPANGRGRDGPPGGSIQPSFDCTFSPGPDPFEVQVSLLVYQPSAEASMYVSGRALITRPPGACQ
jgi:hypothetical protein